MIAEGLKNGGRFPYSMLRYERDAIEEFWEWWWSEQDCSSLQRPYTVADGDALLEETLGKPYADTLSESLFFIDTLGHALESEKISKHQRVPREEFRTQIVDFLSDRCSVGDPDQPEVIFTGGGYGAGKTTTLSFLFSRDIFPKVPGLLKALQGVDYCKQLLPEFICLKNVADGRASELCQKESRVISSELFERLLNERKSFAWDSSMSNPGPSMGLLNKCREAGYKISLVAVETDPQVAVKRAMQRAKATRRFAHPDFLLKSHKDFLDNLPEYWAFVDRALHIDNSKESVSKSECVTKVVDSKGKFRE